jgi:hypothetical protein
MAGILPHIADKNGGIYFLFGRERIKNNSVCSDHGLWSDFGGLREKGETLKACAIREEVKNFVDFSPNHLLKSV